MANNRRQVAYLFHEGSGDKLSPKVRGGKGSGLAEMARLGMPVPPGFTVSTTVARAFFENGVLPGRLFGQLERGIGELEKRTGKAFRRSGKVFGSIDNHPQNPLLLSVRSGAAASMPGMMESVLNLGLTSEIVERLIQKTGNARFVYDLYRRLLASLGTTVLDAVEKRHFEDLLQFAKEQACAREDRQLPADLLKELCDMYFELIEESSGSVIIENPLKQLLHAICAVLNSWHSERAIAYRRSQNLPDWWGTAINIQAMVFGNLNDRSSTGVVFSRNVATGAPGLYGEFMVCAQGEDLVSGIRTPQPIEEMAEWNPAAYHELEVLVRKLENHFGHVVDVEFTVEDGRLFLLQCRKAKMAFEAAAIIAVHYVWEGRHGKEEAVAKLSPAEAWGLSQPLTFDPEEVQRFFDQGSAVWGLPASPGVAVGRAVFSSKEAVRRADKGEKVVLVRPDTSPDDLPGMLCSVAIVTFMGGKTSHAAVVACELNKPCVVSAEAFDVQEGDVISVDGTQGIVVLGRISASFKASLQKEVCLFMRWFKKLRSRNFTPPCIGFEYVNKETSANTVLNDFYLAGAMAQNAVGTALAGKANDLKKQVHRECAEFLVCYLAVAVAGEVRHARPDWEDTAQWVKALEEEYGVLFGKGDRHEAQMPVINRLSEMPPEKHVNFFRLAANVFESEHWGGSIGGPRWAAIARAGLGFLDGTLNHTVFSDHTFDLRHNGGRLFNKNPMAARKTSDHGLQDQLNLKKRTENISDLCRGLWSHHSDFSPAVQELWQEGVRLGAWQEGQSE